MNLILTSSEGAYGLFNLNKDVNIFVSNMSLFFFLCAQCVLFFDAIDMRYYPINGDYMKIAFYIFLI